MVVVEDALTAVKQLETPSVAGVWIGREQLPEISELKGLSQSGAMLRDMPEGVALLDSESARALGEREIATMGGHRR